MELKTETFGDLTEYSFSGKVGVETREQWVEGVSIDHVYKVINGEDKYRTNAREGQVKGSLLKCL